LIPFGLRLLYLSFVLFWAGLTLFCRYTTLGNHSPFYKTLLQAFFHLQSWPIGVFIIIISLFISIPLGSPDSPLVVISSSLKRGECLSKVTMGRYSRSCPTFVTWVGICPSYNCVITILRTSSLLLNRNTNHLRLEYEKRDHSRAQHLWIHSFKDLLEICHPKNTS
jgi:hypothetical protein